MLLHDEIPVVDFTFLDRYFCILINILEFVLVLNSLGRAYALKIFWIILEQYSDRVLWCTWPSFRER